MLNRKLLEVLSRLSAADHKRLRLFLESPYFNNLRNAGEMLRLYDYIMAFGADETHPQIDKEVAFQFFFPDKPFREKEKGPLDSLTTELFGLVKRFLVEKELERSELEQRESFALLRLYREHGLEDRFWHTVTGLRKMQEKVSLRDARYYFNQFSIEEEVCNFRTLFNTFEDDANLVKVHQNIDAYYSIVKMEYQCQLVYQHMASQIPLQPDSLLTQAILEMPDEDFPFNNTLIIMYKLVIGLFKNSEDREIFSKFELLLEQQKNKIPLDKYRDLQAFYRIFLSKHYAKSGNPFSRQKMFEVFKEHFEKEYFYVEGKVTIAALRILIVFALKLGQFEWAKKVLDEHPPERICGTRFPAEAHNLNYGEYYFYKKEYEAAKERVTYRPFENPHLGILADVLLIKIYFETRDELLEYRMKALDQKVRRTKMTDLVKERYYNFLKKLDKVVKYAWQKDNPRREKLAEEIRTIPEIIEREWLLEKLEEAPPSTFPKSS